MPWSKKEQQYINCQYFAINEISKQLHAHKIELGL